MMHIRFDPNRTQSTAGSFCGNRSVKQTSVGSLLAVFVALLHVEAAVSNKEKINTTTLTRSLFFSRLEMTQSVLRKKKRSC